jgi:hypothetical protein
VVAQAARAREGPARRVATEVRTNAHSPFFRILLSFGVHRSFLCCGSLSPCAAGIGVFTLCVHCVSAGQSWALNDESDEDDDLVYTGK